MPDDEKDIELMWELSEKEATLAENPSAEGYRQLARKYQDLGWMADANKFLELAAQYTDQGKGATPPPSINGGFGGETLGRLLRAIHGTQLTGELLLETSQTAFSLYFDEGELVTLLEADREESKDAAQRLAEIPAGRYTFTPKEPPKHAPRLQRTTMEVIQSIEQSIASSSR